MRGFTGTILAAGLALGAGTAQAQPAVDMTGRQVQGCELHRALGRAIPPECQPAAAPAAEQPAQPALRFRGVVVLRRPPGEANNNDPGANAPQARPADPPAGMEAANNPPAGTSPAADPPPAAQPPAMPPAAAAEPPPPSRETPRSVALSIQFEFGSDRLTPDAQRQLDAIAEVLRYAPNAADRFRIDGHTDGVGSDGFNQALSERRARAVVNYLVSRHGIVRERLESRGLGRSQPLLPDNPLDARNRRVQVSNIGG